MCVPSCLCVFVACSKINQRPEKVAKGLPEADSLDMMCMSCIFGESEVSLDHIFPGIFCFESELCVDCCHYNVIM